MDDSLNPASDPEDTGHSFYDVFVIRAYDANLGPTRTNMQRLINTARFVLYQGTNQFGGQINGVSNTRRYERRYLNYGWIEMSGLDREFYRMNAERCFDQRPIFRRHSRRSGRARGKTFLGDDEIHAAGNCGGRNRTAADAAGFTACERSKRHSGALIAFLVALVCIKVLLRSWRRSRRSAASRNA